jgi:uncharacterized membrane protein
MLFQKNIIKKYLAILPAQKTSEAWEKYQSYFLNADIQQMQILDGNNDRKLLK